MRMPCLFVAALAAFPAAAQEVKPRPPLPDGFSRLADIAPSIRQDMRYAGSDNVLGRPLVGYVLPACIVTRQAAAALSKAQADLEARKLTLVVFDCYRPIRAVDDLVKWTKAGGGVDAKWHPEVSRGDLIAKGYVGLNSSHSRGSTVDVAIAYVEFSGEGTSPACGTAAPGMLDFGVGFDCFDEASKTESALVSPAAAAHRQLLVETMRRHGFRNYAGEWWHFTLKDEPFKERRFDFPVD